MAFAHDWVLAACQALQDSKEELTDLDSRIGDGDHGINMARGAQHVAQLDASAFGQSHNFNAGAYFKKVGMTLVSHVGGASGPLYGTFFLRMGSTIGANRVDAKLFAAAVEAGLEGMKARGRSHEGEKTMIDVWQPALCAMKEALASGGTMDAMLHRGLEAGEKGAQATIDMVATKGRASYLGERSRGTMDPGAASSVIWLRAAAAAWQDSHCAEER